MEEQVADLLPPKQNLDSHDIFRIQERETLRLLINYGGHPLEQEEGYFCNYILNEIKEVEFKTPLYKKMLSLYKNWVEQGTPPTQAIFLNQADAEVKQEAIALMSQKHEVSAHWKDKFQIFIQFESDDLAHTAFKSILRLKRRLLQKLMEEAIQKIKEAESSGQDQDQVGEFQTIYLELKKMKLSMDKELGIVVG